MSLLRIASYILLTILVGCGQNTAPGIKPEARLLNDSAVALIRSSKNEDYQKAILLLEKAIAIDTAFVRAYQNKLSFETRLNQYDQALVTSKELNKLRPENPDFLMMTGVLYEKNGDSISSVRYFESSLARYNSILDTINVKTPNYFVVQMYKGINLILLNRPAAGNQILKSLYDNQADEMYKEALKPFINGQKQTILENMFKRQKVTSTSPAKQ
ncbi:MAG: hypothetical protein ABI416_14195 [Ginsengibacter sp.]